MAERTHKTGALLVASLALLGVSAVETYGEVSPYFVSGFSAERRFLALSSGDYHAGRSLWSKDMVLRDCLDVANTIYAKAQPTTKRTAFLERCEVEASAIATVMPAYARAWLVQASTAAELGRFDDFVAALRRATYTAPNAHWAAERRTELAERYLDKLPARDIAAYERDLRNLLDSEAGTQLLARRYVRQPELRARLTAVAGGAPAELQRRFLRQVEIEAKGASQ